ncbi:hypothetical protein Taitung71_05800 [Helicobacter pylori]
MPYRLEKDFQDLITNNSNIQKDICSVLEMDYKDFKLLREDTYINGITADFTLFERNKVRAIMALQQTSRFLKEIKLEP